MKRKKSADRLKNFGLRPTKARMLILNLLEGSTAHPSPEDMLEHLRDQGHPLSPATLYQNLNKLSQSGLLKCFQGIGDRMRFDANLTPHHHLICDHCDRIVDVTLTNPPTKGMRLMMEDPHRPLDQWVIHEEFSFFRGICPTCRQSVVQPV
jgi:Fe2+ or Zn2+ uptake regulation protein